jgi:hypothetical protein
MTTPTPNGAAAMRFCQEARGTVWRTADVGAHMRGRRGQVHLARAMRACICWMGYGPLLPCSLVIRPLPPRYRCAQHTAVLALGCAHRLDGSAPFSSMRGPCCATRVAPLLLAAQQQQPRPRCAAAAARRRTSTRTNAVCCSSGAQERGSAAAAPASPPSRRRALAAAAAAVWLSLRAAPPALAEEGACAPGVRARSARACALLRADARPALRHAPPAAQLAWSWATPSPPP